MNLCIHGHDKDVMGVRKGTNGCLECHRISNRKRVRSHGTTEYHRSYDAVRKMIDGGMTLPTQRLRKRVDKESAMKLWAAHWHVSQSAGYHAMLRLWQNPRIDIDQADRWCIVLGTHLCIVYPECYHPAAFPAGLVDA